MSDRQIIQKDFALKMQRLLANEQYRYRDYRYYLVSARWWFWQSKISANPNESLRQAKDQFKLARHMQSNHDYYARKPFYMTEWQWFLKLGLGEAA